MLRHRTNCLTQSSEANRGLAVYWPDRLAALGKNHITYLICPVRVKVIAGRRAVCSDHRIQ